MNAATLTRSALALAAALAGFGAAAAGPAAPAVRADEPVHLHWTERGDTLIGLGRRFLIDPGRWPEIARANRVRNPNRIPTGTVLRIPLRLMHTDARSATVVQTTGEVRDGSAAPLQAGQTLPEGAAVQTGADGHATVRLIDGTLLRLRPASRLELSESRQVRDTPVLRTGASLERGRVEVEAAKAGAGRPGFEIRTPQGVMGVRGTEFRVAADAQGGISRGEVLEGAVAVRGGAAAAEQQVGAGFGTVVDAAGRVAPPVRLLEPPDTTVLPTLQERILMRFQLPPAAGAQAWRGQIAREMAFDQVLADLTSATPELRFAELPDGDYVLRVRAIDAQGLEGRDALHRFRLKARPEAPLPAQPAPRAVLFGDRAEFQWTANREAATYRLQLAQGDAWTAPLRDLTGLSAPSTVVAGLVPGAYRWRLASVRADGDQGPWGVVRAFDLRPPPPRPAPPAVGDRSVRFSWEGGAGQTYDFEVARDEGFADKVFEQRLAKPEVELPLPGVGRFFVRLRAREADGFVGPYGTTQSFDVPNCLRDGSGGCVRATGRPLTVAP